jgi:hypothetical protein
VHTLLIRPKAFRFFDLGQKSRMQMGVSRLV